MNNAESCPFLGSPEHTCDQLGPAHGHTCSRCLSPRPSRLFPCIASRRHHRVIDSHRRPRSCWLCWPIGAAPMCQPRPPPPPPRSHCVRENESRGLKEQGHRTRAPRSAPPAVRDELGVLPEVRGQLKEALLLTPQTVGMRALRWRRQTMREHDGRPEGGTWSQLDAPRAPLVRPCRAAVLAPGPHAFLDPTSSCGDRRRRAVPKTWQVKVPD